MYNNSFFAKEIQVPQSSSDYIGQSSERVRQSLEDAGFKSITDKVNQDSSLLADMANFLKKSGTVISITINGESSFKKGDSFPTNATIILYIKE